MQITISQSMDRRLFPADITDADLEVWQHLRRSAKDKLLLAFMRR